MSFFLKIRLVKYRDLATGVYLSEAHSPPGLLFGVVKQFCRLGIWSKYTVYNFCICSPHNPSTCSHREGEEVNQ
jgi:hypothetical protein